MTNKEAKQWLIDHFGLEKDGTKQSEVMNYLVDLLEQEPILDRIKAEIRKLDDINPDYPMDRTIHISRNEVLNIIDRYRQEE